MAWEPNVLPLRLAPEVAVDPARGNIARGLLAGKSMGYSFGYYGNAALTTLTRSREDGEYSCDIRLTVKEWRQTIKALANIDEAMVFATDENANAFTVFYETVRNEIHNYSDDAKLILRGFHSEHPDDGVDDEG